MAEYYKHEIAKWNVATDDLTLEQEAAYHRIVVMIRLYERPLKHNLRVLSGLWRCNERKAKRLLFELVDAGKLTIEDDLIIDEKAVNDASNLRQLRIDKQLSGSLGGIESGKSRAKSLENKETDEAPASTREEKKREEKSKSEFALFWEVVPLKVGKAVAEKAYEKALKQTTHEKIMAAMQAYAATRVGQDHKYTKHPASWLNAGRWDDVAAPVPKKDPEPGDYRINKHTGKRQVYINHFDGWLNEL